MVDGLDREPRHRLAGIGIEHEIERELRHESVERHRLDHAIGRQRQAGEQGCDRDGAVGHGDAIGDVFCHVDGGGVGSRQQLVPCEFARLAADSDCHRRFGRLREARQQQEHDRTKARIIGLPRFIERTSPRGNITPQTAYNVRLSDRSSIRSWFDLQGTGR
jgi:hypothetical protein